MSAAIAQQVVIRIAPLVGFEVGQGVGVIGGTAAKDPFLSIFGLEEPLFAKEFEPVTAAIKKGAGQVAFHTQAESVKLAGGITQLFKMPTKPSGATSPPSGPPPPVIGGGGSVPSQPGRPARLSDFKTAAKIAAVGGALTGAGLGVNEALKELSETTGGIVENAAEGISKGLDNIGKSVGDALSPILDPLGINDPETKANIGKWLVIAGAVGIGIFALIMVMRK